MATRMLSHDEIEIGGGTQARSEINYFVVNEYAEHYRNGVEFPPLVVYDDGAKKWLSRGFHRFHASKDAGVEKVDCEVRKGSKRDATWDSISDNQDHGLRRTNADKRKAVEMAIRDVEWAEMSNVAIADHVGVAESFVRKTRDEYEEQVRTERTKEKRTGKDGKKQASRKKKRRKSVVEPREEPRPSTECDVAETNSDSQSEDRLRVSQVLNELELALEAIGVDCDREISGIRSKLILFDKECRRGS